MCSIIGEITGETPKRQSFTRTCESLALTREVNLATQPSASLADEIRESGRIFLISEYVLPNNNKCFQNQNCLLVTRQNDNHSPGPGPLRLVPSSHQRSELSNTILGTFSKGDKRVWKCIPIPNGLGEKATLINISVSNGNPICR